MLGPSLETQLNGLNLSLLVTLGQTAGASCVSSWDYTAHIDKMISEL
jgi:hypothetical protein